VIDISNFAAPNVVRTLSYQIQPLFSKQRFMYLSPDERILFVSCFETLEIINATNPESAYNLKSVWDNKFREQMGSFAKYHLSISFVLPADLIGVWWSSL